jgi:hypothetical protein
MTHQLIEDFDDEAKAATSKNRLYLLPPVWLPSVS